MRIHYFSGGPAGMYCGSCIRDNALAAELMRQGHKVLLLPVYTPTVTDEENVSESRVFLGGVNVYLSEYVPLVRRLPRWMKRWLDAPSVLNLLTRFAISNNARQLGELTVSMLRGEHGPQKQEFEALLEWLRTQPRPDIVSLPYSLLISLAAPLKRALGCAVACTLQGEDLFLDGLTEPWRSEARELIRTRVADADGFIAVSEYYAGYMAEYLGIPREKIHVVPLGVSLAGLERGPERDAAAPFTIGFFARVAPEKGLHNLVDAYIHLRRNLKLERARLEVAGWMAAEHRGYLSRLEQKMQQAGLGDEFAYRGVLNREEKIRFLQSLDVLSVPGDYAEPKGLFVLEAMACGVPVVQPRHGAFPETIARTGGGLLVEPGRPEKLAEALLKIWSTPELRSELSRMGYQSVRAHYSVQAEAARALEVYAAVRKTAGETRAE